jgi:hypothetical protein
MDERLGAAHLESTKQSMQHTKPSNVLAGLSPRENEVISNLWTIEPLASINYAAWGRLINRRVDIKKTCTKLAGGRQKLALHVGRIVLGSGGCTMRVRRGI